MTLIYRTVENGKIVKKERKIKAKEALDKLMEKKGKSSSKLKGYYEKGKKAATGFGSFLAEAGQGVAKSAKAHERFIPKPRKGESLTGSLMGTPSMYGGPKKAPKKKKRKLKPRLKLKPKKPTRKEVYYYD